MGAARDARLALRLDGGEGLRGPLVNELRINEAVPPVGFSSFAKSVLGSAVVIFRHYRTWIPGFVQGYIMLNSTHSRATGRAA
jgi:hypothetical protein